MKVRRRTTANSDGVMARLSRDPLPKGIGGRLPVLCLLFFLLTSCMTVAEKQAVHVPQDTSNENGLANAKSSMDELCKEVLEKVAENDIKSLEAMAMSEDEVKRYVWPYSEWSRPEVRMPFEFYWGDMHQKSSYALRKTMAHYGGKKFEFISLFLGEEPMEYQNGKIYRDARIMVRNDDGREGEIKIFGSVFELNGNYKIFSFVRE